MEKEEIVNSFKQLMEAAIEIYPDHDTTEFHELVNAYLLLIESIDGDEDEYK